MGAVMDRAGGAEYLETARRAGRAPAQRALAFQRLELFLKTADGDLEVGRDLAVRGRAPLVADRRGDEVENGALAPGQNFRHANRITYVILRCA